MLPDIDCQQRRLSFNERDFRVCRFDDFELVARFHEPGPSGAELRHACVLQFFFEVVIAAEVSVQVFDAPGYDPWRAARFCYETLSRARDAAGGR